MSKFNASIAGVVAALFLSGTAMAATLQPAAGEFSAMSQPVATQSAPVTRSAVEAQAAQSMPAAGEFSGVHAASAQAAVPAHNTVSLAELRASTSPAAEAATY